MNEIRLNFLPLINQDLDITIFRKRVENSEYSKELNYYDLRDEEGDWVKYEVVSEVRSGYEEYKIPPYSTSGIIAKNIYQKLKNAIEGNVDFIIKSERIENKRIHIVIGLHPKGKKCIWIEPYFLKSKSIWGIQIGYQFVVDDRFKVEGKVTIDREILIASGTLNNKGQSNLDFYLFKHEHFSTFIKSILPKINHKLENKISTDLQPVDGYQLKYKQYIFKNGVVNSSPYQGLSKNEPFEKINESIEFYFIYLKENRDFAANLLKGLRGDTFPSLFPGFQRMFKIDFSNERIKGKSIEKFDNDTIKSIVSEIKASDKNIFPIIITINRKDSESEELYYRLKHQFTNESIPCQVVTKELIGNEYSIKYSLSNIALQIFAKLGGKPWKMMPAKDEYLIVGIGQSYNIEEGEHGNIIEKNITYSILTDSSGIFKDLQVLGEGVESDDNYYSTQVSNLIEIIKNSGYKKVAIHSPFKLSKSKILEKVAASFSDLELSVLVINDKTDHFGFDYNNNGLVPFESTFVKLASDEYLIWFEGLQNGNPKITKRFSNPLNIKFWYTNKPELFDSYDYKEELLQDSINLSGANWRGFKAKQLPISIFYCQRIADFIAKFREYKLESIDINNLKPWFL